MIYATFVVISTLCAFLLVLLFRGAKNVMDWVIGHAGRNDDLIQGRAELRKPWGW